MHSVSPAGAVPEYVPSWMKKAPSLTVSTTATMQPPPPMPTKSRPTTSVTRTANNITNTFASYTPSYLTQSPPQPLGSRSPILAKRLPMRMSPAIVPSRNHMNPSAAEFVPGSGAGFLHGLDILPTSTADLELHGQSSTPAAATTPAILEQKSEAEIREISQRSGLKVGAAVYVPRRTMARVVLVKPSPLALTPSADPTKDGIELMFNDLWCLFFLSTRWGENIKEEDYNPTLVFRIDSIPTFWKVFNNIPAPSTMTMSTLYMFRDGINPRWEDEANREGGIVKAKIPADRIDEVWELLLCRTVGDSWAAPVRNTVNGVVLKVRDHGYLVELWVTKNSPELVRDLAELWKGLLGNVFATTYFSHAAIQERSQAAAAAAAEKRKSQRGKRY